ncbi:aspartate/glutamate racemase family protein [Pararhodobacter zhoushanensis]|uniref:Aspartate/glutamate racemase family protein n=1 Tax=Pararhodobacter zhoushanensis TaxID=2479545 RepID=A0ABT3H464_9RHOB|nr:aspartate/glutamate racemase family protein [Pararhodobacter zhoushanensis]MCW1934582.1 aspartate/glutamate racemase family protein [Pararhodobacter zhoushanensis]
MTDTPRRLLIVNPNGNPEVTARTQACADRILGPGCNGFAVQPAGSPHAIETPADRALAEPLALALLAQHPGYDAYVMACFDDIAIAPARAFLKAPILDAVEASVAAARSLAQRFSIVTTVEAMVPGIEALVARLGAASQCSVRAAGIGVAAAAAGEPEALRRLDATIVRARDQDGAQAIILGSGGLTGHAARLSQRHGLPVIDGIEAAIRRAEAASRIAAKMA